MLLISFVSVFPSGELFAKCPVDDYPGIAVEGVLDSSRYFVLKIVDETGRCISVYYLNRFIILMQHLNVISSKGFVLCDKSNKVMTMANQYKGKY